jgi:hypothetical protein
MRNPFRSVPPVVEVKAAAGVSTTTAQGFVQFSQSAAVNYAMNVPTISRARDLLASVVGAATIEQYAQQLDPVTGETSHVDLAPTGWMDRPDPAVTRNFLLANTFGDLFFFGRAFWLITSRYANGYPASFTWLPAADIQTADQQPPQWFGPSPQVTFGGQQISAGDLVQFLSPITGLIYTAPRAIRTAYRLDAAAERFALTEIPSGYLQQVGGEPMTSDELADLAAAWATARQENAVGALNESVKWVESSTDPSKLQLTEGRSYSALELARASNVPPYLVGVSVGGYTYQNAEQARGDLVTFGARPYIDCIEQTLSGPNVLPRGRYCELNLGVWLRDPLGDHISLEQAVDIAQV